MRKIFRPNPTALALLAAALAARCASPVRAAEPAAPPPPASVPPAPAAGAPAAAKVPAGDFAAGTWTLNLYAGFDREFGGDPQLGYGAIGVGYFAFDNFSVNAEARTLYADQDDGRDTTVYALDLLIRHHLVRGDGWSLFVNASAAVSQSLYRIPAGGTHFNFMEEAGVGATYRVADRVHLIGGVRYWHLSNARIEGGDRNPALNGFGGYLGLMFTF
jgi:hypothetical protein